MTGELEEIIMSMINEQTNENKSQEIRDMAFSLQNICAVLENISDTLKKMYSNLL